MISGLDWVNVFLSFFMILNNFGTPFRGVFWDKNVKKWSMEKQAKNEPNIFMQAMQVIPGIPPCGPLKELKNNQQLVPSFLP